MMALADWIILSVYLIGTVFVGVFLGRYVKNASDMFAAGGQSPWWISGLSAFMTMFSANTFVVWGGIAYQYGIVAIVINLCYGIAAIAVGFTVAGKWKAMGIATPAAYVEQRFGRAALHFYTWFMMAFRIVGVGGALYAIARLTLAVIGGENSAGSASLSGGQLNLAILIFAVAVVGYTMVGGLWAVLITDTLQFVILNLAILFVIPLALMQVGGVSEAMAQLPDGFLSLTNEKYTFMFLAGWVAIHYFMVGADWAFVQRHICVPSKKDARKSTFLFGGLYLFSPFLWLLPPILWRIQQPIPEGASPEAVTHMAETAYILSCKAVLPVGMLGLMLAALFSATASMISSQLNVFSGVLTENIYRPLVSKPSQRQLVRAGRTFTFILGGLVALIAIATPYLGGAAALIISITQVMVTPLLAPTLLSVYVPRLGTSSIWATVGLCFPLGLLSKFTDVFEGTWFADATVTGVLLPLLVVLATCFIQRQEAPGWKRVQNLYTEEEGRVRVASSQFPGQIVSCSLAICGLTLLCLIPINETARGMLGLFSLGLFALSLVLWLISNRVIKGTSE